MVMGPVSYITRRSRRYMEKIWFWQPKVIEINEEKWMVEIRNSLEHILDKRMDMVYEFSKVGTCRL